MIVAFDCLPDKSRIWIFSSSGLLDDSTCESLLKDTFDFLGEWTAHNKALTASAIIEDNAFLVVAVDESTTGASGCSIDKLYRFIKDTESRYFIHLLDRLNVVFPGNPPVFSHTSKLQALVDSGELDDGSIVYDTTIVNLGQFRRLFRVPMQSTWMSRYLQNA